MGQLYEPSFDVELVIVPLSEPPLYSSILTFEPGLPEELHVILWLVPHCQNSPPFGEVTVIDGNSTFTDSGYIQLPPLS
ncbi:MAG TPA: hypothetical protein VMZ06_05610 [Candidatus Bathyarchaeia archaeon]|nr:hypothetical protein [Candidatus Bathyarchaeia archaeon]